MIGKEKLHVVALQAGRRPASRNNQADLNDKSSIRQSLSRARSPCSVLAGRHPSDRNRSEKVMTQIQAIDHEPRRGRGNVLGRAIALLYGVATYFFFFVTFLYAIGFVEGLVVPKTIDSGSSVPLTQAIIIDLLLLSVFAIQHSVMARQQFKQWWTQFVPRSVERTTYVLLSSLALALLIWQWRAMPAIVWQIANPQIAMAVTVLSLIGWLIVLTSTFLINHFELFGLHQVASHFAGRAMPAPRFRAPLYYHFVRHPIYLGFIIAFWAAPTMTAGHLLFAAMTTAYILVGIQLEEHDLIEEFGDQYRSYKARVSMLIPWRKSS
jgi:protein-S-isoprenylcysteine O-methyltransferase Ste14